MRYEMTAAMLAAFLATGAFAQADTGSHNPAIKNGTAHSTMNGAKGRNSFTETQAQGRLAKAGYADVSKLMKDDNGVWRGTAMKNGAKVDVGLDYKGNVVVR